MPKLNYDPNIRWSTKTVRLVFGQWQYRKSIEVEIDGNTLGLSVIQCAMEAAFDQLSEGNEAASVELAHHQRTLEIMIENQNDLDDLLVHAEIIAMREAHA